MDNAILEEQIGVLSEWILNSNNIVFFGGAGVSTESGIPDFRSTDGIYRAKYPYPPEKILSHGFFMSHTAEFYDFYRDKMVHRDAKPNITHKKLAWLEKAGMLKGIVTQNIDGLHQKAGSKKVLELHGSVLRYYCIKCGKFYELDHVLDAQGVPTCECSGIIKPDVVLYEEPLDEGVMEEAIELIRKAEVLIVGGTSLSVYPAAGLLHYYEGDKLVLINKTVTAFDKRINLMINAGLGEVFSFL